MIWQGFLIGLVGSLHCIGMCGPIALIIPTSKNEIAKFFQIITYNFGRILTYSMFGLIVGLLGETFRFAEIQQYVSIVLGVLIILIVIATLLSYHKAANMANKWTTVAFRPIKTKLSKIIGKERKNLLGIGIMNGFLPCGLIYIALIKSITANSIPESVGFMAAFGLGTIPAMMTVMYFRSLINKKINVSKVVPYMMLVVGFMLVMRGMNMGIPYLSPEIQKTETEQIVLGGCCSADKQFENE
ncbi:MAG: sulfite exporter TauE/SafE family protein [Flavobacteriales bacterium]